MEGPATDSATGRSSGLQANSSLRMIGDLVSKETDEGLTLETSVFESFTVANLPYRPCG